MNLSEAINKILEAEEANEVLEKFALMEYKKIPTETDLSHNRYIKYTVLDKSRISIIYEVIEKSGSRNFSRFKEYIFDITDQIRDDKLNSLLLNK